MTNNTECLNGIVGVTRKDCECITDELAIPESGEIPADNEWYKKSNSGFYIHELDGIVPIDSVKDVVSCEKLSDFYKRIIESSIVETANDIAASINERYKKRESNFVGFIGARSSSKVLPMNISSQYAGLKVEVAERTGGVIVVKGIGVLMNATAEFNIEVYRRYIDTDLFELVDTIESINSNANSYTENIFEEPLILPMQIDNEGDIEYFFLYQFSDSFYPRNNLASCGCGRKEHQLKKLIDYGGVQGVDVDEMSSWIMTEFSNGLVLDAEIRCNAEAMLCTMYNVSPEWGKFVAHAVIYKSAWKIHKAILSSNNITQEIMANREGVDENMNMFDSEYWTRIKYLVQNVDLKLNDCYTCDNKKMKVTQILL